MHKRRGFTLIELLFVIAIIAILMYVLMHSLRDGRVHHSSGDASVTAISSASAFGKVITILSVLILLTVGLQSLCGRDDKAILISRREWLFICRLLLSPIIARFSIQLNDASPLIIIGFGDVIVPVDEYIRFVVVNAPPNGPNAQGNSALMYRTNSIGIHSLKGKENGFQKMDYDGELCVLNCRFRTQ
jgi:prepilin-type N-terminal cleavage/methylation domain-containing protein